MTSKDTLNAVFKMIFFKLHPYFALQTRLGARSESLLYDWSAGKDKESFGQEHGECFSYSGEFDLAFTSEMKCKIIDKLHYVPKMLSSTFYTAFQTTP